MPRKPRMEFAGAVYHVMCRGNAGQRIYADDLDRRVYLSTLGEACNRCGWRIHAYILMSNHYHLLLETPEANLVAGMKWLQGTYTQRFNVRHRRCGHLFQGRYKALPILAVDGYFEAVSSYIHLNPVRARLLNLEKGDLADYRWSSYPGYVCVKHRAPWLCVTRVLGARHWTDGVTGRRAYRLYMTRRVREILQADQSGLADKEWERIRRGWYLGSAEFKDRLESLVAKQMHKHRRASYSGAAVELHDERRAEHLLQRGLQILGLDRRELAMTSRGADEKCLLAWLIRRQTAVPNEWICRQLDMGRPDCLSRYPRKIEETRSPRLLALKRRLEKNTRLRD